MTYRLTRHGLISLLCAVFSAFAQASDYMSPGLTAEQVLQKLGNDKPPLVVDVRNSVEYGVAHIPGAINIPLSELDKRIDELRQDNGVLIYCINGARTRQAEPIVYANDITNVYHLKGAFQGWIQGKYPIEKGGMKKSGW